MGLYYCGHSDCRGHDAFSAQCSPVVIPDYPVLVAFQQMADLEPLPVPAAVGHASHNTIQNQRNSWRRARMKREPASRA